MSVWWPQQQSPHVVAIDVDEVLCCYVESFRKFLRQQRPDGPLDMPTVFREAHNPQSPWRLQFALTGGIDNLEAMPGSASALRRLRAAGVEIQVITSRPPVMRGPTEAMLQRLFPPDTFAAAHFVGAGQKGRTCNRIGAIALVDDQIPNVIDAASCGVASVLFDYCGNYFWSQCHPDQLPPRVKRIETWAATCDYLLSLLGHPEKPPVTCMPVNPHIAASSIHNIDVNVNAVEGLEQKVVCCGLSSEHKQQNVFTASSSSSCSDYVSTMEAEFENSPTFSLDAEGRDGNVYAEDGPVHNTLQQQQTEQKAWKTDNMLAMGALELGSPWMDGMPFGLNVQRPKCVYEESSASRPFVIHIEKVQGEQLGIEIDARKLMVRSVMPGGAVAAWNDEHPQHKIQAGDRILEVNGRHGVNSILEECEQEVELAIVVQREGFHASCYNDQTCKPTCSVQ